MRFFNILAVVICLSGAAIAQDEPLPESVSSAYLAYEAAVQAGDAQAAAEAAERAWRAGEAEGIDRALQAILASNAGEALSAIGDRDAALDAYQRSIRLQEQGAPDPAELGVSYRLASELAYLEADMREARRLAERALELHADMQGEAGIAQRLRAYYVLIQSEGALGRFNRAGRWASDAVEEGAAHYERLPSAYGLPAFYVGASHAYDGDNEEAAYWFSVCYSLLAELDREMTVRDAADAWGDYLREGMNERDQQRLLARLIEGGYLLDPDTEAGLARAGLNSERSRNFVPAEATRRLPPQYPMDAARAGAEGFALLRYDVDLNGRAVNAQVIYSLPYRDFGEASLDVLQDWEFTVATLNGVPVVDEGRVITMDFRLMD